MRERVRFFYPIIFNQDYCSAMAAPRSPELNQNVFIRIKDHILKSLGNDFLFKKDEYSVLISFKIP